MQDALFREVDMKVIFFIIIAIASSAIKADQAGSPDEQYNCILGSLKSGLSVNEAKMIRESCRRKYSRQDDVILDDLPTSILLSLTATLQQYDKNLILTVNNGSNIWHIYELKIRITNKRSGTYSDHISRYSWCEPLSTCEFSLQLPDLPENISWTIVGGRGQHVP
jgi:hypothetical protein